MFTAIDLTGRKFGIWTVLSRADDNVGKNGYRTVMWNCKCECGAEKIIRGKTLTSGVSRSCGCLQRELVGERASKHHGFGTRLYAVWNSMRQRCNNPKHHAYNNYGGRGISICKEWDDYQNFRDWALSVGYDEDAERGVFTLDRVDVDKGYFPDNCRFTNMREQTNNRRESIIVEHDGESHPLTIWAEILGEKYCTLWKRYKEGREIFT